MAGNKNLEVFMKKLFEDEKLLSELQKASTKDPQKGAYNFALSHSEGGFSEDEFKECVQEILEGCAAKIQEMREEELETVAGGLGDNNIKEGTGSRRELNEAIIALLAAQTANAKNASPQVVNSAISEQAASAQGKWNAITAGINSLGNISKIIETFGNIWATYKNRKDLSATRKVQNAQAMLQLEGLKAEIKNKYGYTDEQIDHILENI